MDPVTRVIRGTEGLLGFLAEATFDLREQDLPGFRCWLDRLLARWRSDPVFIRRVGIRDLRRAHPDLGRREAEYRRAAAADADSPQVARLRELDHRLAAARKAIAGLSAAWEAAPPDRRPALAAKRDGFETELAALLVEQDALTRASPERQALITAGEALERARAAAGVTQEEAELARLLTARGRRSGRSGESFEETVAAWTGRHAAAELTTDGPVQVLRRVRLGAARAEFDMLVVRTPGDPDLPVDVLAVVEAKRNVNDLAHGFRRRQEDLAWVTNDPTGYDPALTRTGRFPAGHFDRPAGHREGGRVFRFVPGSFRRFRRDPATGFYLDGLYLMSRAGPVWGLSSAALARVADRVATDDRSDPDDAGYLSGLYTWCRFLPGPVETPDVLRLYGAAESRARRVILLPRVADETSAGELHPGGG